MNYDNFWSKRYLHKLVSGRGPGTNCNLSKVDNTKLVRGCGHFKDEDQLDVLKFKGI